ncbi:MAG: hypothetical protein CMM50_00440 [Rhodospirillaceae bacterium]|nr:hypothetical protein [Rhodospirillaceae bacterium]
MPLPVVCSANRLPMLILFLIVFIDLVGFGIIIPLTPFYAEHFGASPDVVTLLTPTYSLAQFIFAPVWGRLSDRYGRKPILLLTLAGAVAAYTVYGFADSLVALFLARAFAGAMAGNIAVAQAFMADITTPETRAKGMGLIGAAFGLGFILGPAIGGTLAGHEPGNLNFALPAMAAAGASLVAIVLTFILLKEPERARGPQARVGRIAELVQSLRRPNLGVLIFLFFLITFAFASMESTFALWSERHFHWGPQQNGYVFAFAGLVSAFIQGGCIGPLTKRFGEVRLLIAGAAILAVGLVLIPLSDGLPLLLVAMALLAVGSGLGNPTLSSLISKATDSDHQGGSLGVAQSASSLARMLGPASAGVVFVELGRSWPFFIAGVVSIIVAIAALRFVRAPAASAVGSASDGG